MNAAHRNTVVSRSISGARAAFTPLLAVLSLMTTVGCGDDAKRAPSETDFPKDLLPAELHPDLPLVAPKSALDIPVFSDVVEIASGADVTFCTFTNVVLDQPTIFRESFGAQSPQGHHAILQYTTTPQEPHTGSCGGAMDGPILLGGTGGKGVADEATLPQNFGVEVPAGAQLILNHHWINTSDKAVTGQAMMLARRLERDGDTVMAGNMIMMGMGWEIPALSRFEYTTECTYGADVPYVLALGHMHEWGQNVRIEVTRAEGTAETLIDEEWTADSATGVGGGTHYSLEEPLMIKAGDTVRLTCSWNNTTAEPLAFPREMCIFFGYTIETNYFCANGSWLTADAAGAAGMGDVGSHL